jgi:hypothetical protein
MYRVSIEKYETGMDDSTYWTDREVVKSFTLETKKEANALRRKLIKKYDLEKYGWHYVNYSQGIELTTTY